MTKLDGNSGTLMTARLVLPRAFTCCLDPFAPPGVDYAGTPTAQGSAGKR